MIGLVLVVILVLVANIVFFGDDPQQTAGEEQQTAQSNTNEKANSSSDDAVTSDEADSKDSESTDADKENADEDSSNKDATDDEKSEEVDKDKDKDKDKEDQKKEKESDQEIPGEQNLDGPWEPVGTVQTGKHVSKYEFGTDDWKEKIKAAESVMGLSEDEMTIWKIGGNGGPQQSFARVSKKGPGNPKYFIELKWIDGKGWKPVSVTKE